MPWYIDNYYNYFITVSTIIIIIIINIIIIIINIIIINVIIIIKNIIIIIYFWGGFIGVEYQLGHRPIFCSSCWCYFSFFSPYFLIYM